MRKVPPRGLKPDPVLSPLACGAWSLAGGLLLIAAGCLYAVARGMPWGPGVAVTPAPSPGDALALLPLATGIGIWAATIGALVLAVETWERRPGARRSYEPTRKPRL
jgi:hypothetical protein